MRKRKIISALLVSLGVLGILGACGSKKAEGSGSDDKKLSVWSVALNPSQTVENWKKSPFHTGLAKASGIDVNWEFPAEGTDTAQAFNLLLSDKKLPDIICYNVVNDAEQYLDDGVIQDLTKVLPKKAPHYWKYLQDHPDLAKAVKTDDGRYYAFGMFKETDQQGAFYGPEIRQDWLDAQHLSMPTNADEYENVLKTFNKAYGAKLAFVPSDLSYSGFSGAFGAHGTFNLGYYIEDGKVKVTQTQQEWKNYMTWLHKLYSEGLIDPDVLTLDDEGLKTKVANEKVGATFNLASRVKIYEEQAKSNGKPSDWSWEPYLNQADGSLSSSIYSSGKSGGTTVWAVTSSAKGKKLDEALKWLDWAFTDEGSEYWNFGEKGVTWEEKDGQRVWTDKIANNPLGISEAKTLYTGLSATGLGVQLLDSTATTTKGAKNEQFAGQVWDNNNTKAREANLPAQLTKTSKESKEAATIENTLNTYCSENALKFMTGEKSLNDYDKFIKEMKSQGLDRLLEIYQATYDRYMKR